MRENEVSDRGKRRRLQITEKEKEVLGETEREVRERKRRENINGRGDRGTLEIQ